MDNPAIQVRGLTFAYPGSPPALRNLHFQIECGETVGLIGPNGAGKTTLFLCLAGVLPAPRGSASILGFDPADPAQRRQLPQRIGVVFQNSDDQFVNATVFDDVAFGPLNLDLPPEEVRERVTEALTLTGLAGLEERPPFHLSGGEKRRVALAGVLAMRPEILLLDEPTMFLDPRGRRELAGFLHNLPGTKIIATHDLEFVLQMCRRVLLLDAGELRADGKAREVLSQTELMDRHGLEVPYSLRAK
ncbi:MAG TPA: ATP-binding cassette domain-containing protein [Gemmataceae bacterium]|nr:ATP-binding cassette domain-containing protein [Gemmataceae bacterium]